VTADAVGWALLAAALAGSAAYLAVSPSAVRRLEALPTPSAGTSGDGSQWLARAGAVAGAGLLGGAYAGMAGVAVVGAVAGFAWHRARRGRVRTQAEETGDAVIALCKALVAELRAGRDPAGALLAAATGTGEPLLPRARAAAASGGDVAAGLRADGTRPGAAGLVWLAACWQVAAHLGAGLAAPVSRVVTGLVDEAAVRRELDLQRAAPRATARLLAGLPLFAVALGTAMGADPVHVLTRTPVGWCCLAVGGLLSGVGVAWTDRLCEGVEARAGLGPRWRASSDAGAPALPAGPADRGAGAPTSVPARTRQRW
jgi:tight adherence protein B